MNEKWFNAMRRFARAENASTAIEYALIAGGIAVAIITVVGALGETVRDELFGKVKTALGS